MPKAAPSSTLRTDSRRSVWIKEASAIREVEVRVGISEGNFTEVASEGLSENTQVIIGELVEETTKSLSNPFVPKMPGTKK